jgi:hypothetical protein
MTDKPAEKSTTVIRPDHHTTNDGITEFVPGVVLELHSSLNTAGILVPFWATFLTRDYRTGIEQRIDLDRDALVSLSRVLDKMGRS